MRLAFIGLVIAAFVVFRQPDDDLALGYLESQGFSEVRLLGYSYTGCGQGDRARMMFTGVRSGLRLSGVICGASREAMTHIMLD